MRYITCLFILLVISGCSPKTTSLVYSGIRYVEQSASRDQITVEVIAISSKAEGVLADGAAKILTALLYQGIPDSPFREPLIQDRNKAEQHQQYLKEIINENSSQFLSNAYLLAPPNKNKRTKEHSATVRATVDVRALKQVLRNEGILPRFGL